MADSVRLKILKNIKTTLEGITTGNGFANTLTNVQLFRMLGNSKVDFPCVIVSPDTEAREEGKSQIVYTEFVVYVTLYHAQIESSTTPTDEFIDSFYQDIIRALLADRERDQNAVDTEVLEVQPFQIEDDQIYYGLSFKLQIKFRTEPDDLTAAR